MSKYNFKKAIAYAKHKQESFTDGVSDGFDRSMGNFDFSLSKTIGTKLGTDAAFYTKLMYISSHKMLQLKDRFKVKSKFDTYVDKQMRNNDAMLENAELLKKLHDLKEFI
jgi:hypothetical protein